jgi:hemolysin activation/secretion protein
MLLITVPTAKRLIAAAIICLGISQIFMNAMAANPTLPGAADAGRVDKDHKNQVPEEAPNSENELQILLPGSEIPEGADKVKFVLKSIRLKGVTAFPKPEIEALYRGYVGKEITLDKVWKIADLITRHYQDSGYFLSQAIVPAQKISGGTFTIKVVEGYIGEVLVTGPVDDIHIVHDLVERLKAEKPAKIKDVESLLLRLNDLPGVSYSATMEPLKDARKDDGAIKLILSGQDKNGFGSISIDNYNSRYLGPFEQTASYEASLLPSEETAISGLLSDPLDKLKYTNASHTVPLSAFLSMQFYGGYTEAHPGYTLSPKDIESNSSNLGLSLKDQFIRQRQENLSGTLSFDGKDNYSDVLGAPLTRDRVRAARANVAYDRDDPLSGHDFINLTFSQGLQVLDSNTAGQEFLSRAGARPDFRELEYGFTRFQSVGESWMAVTSISGQTADGVLYSSEQFGFGGQAFGRAYDPSEFTGDNGIAGSLELRFQGLPTYEGVNGAPYGFYDIGKVWNHDSTPSASGASAGFGIRLESVWGLTGNISIAEPLTRPVGDPESGNGKTPRYLFQMSYKFQ